MPVRQKHGLRPCTTRSLIAHRRVREKLVEREQIVKMPTAYGDFDLHLYRSKLDGSHHLALVKGTISPNKPTLVRVHSECLTGDVFGSRRCDCGAQLHGSLRKIAEQGMGVVVYLRGHEGRGIGIAHKLQAYELQDGGLDTVDANVELGLPVDSREYGIGAQILVDLGVTTMRLMTNNPAKRGGLEGYGLHIVERVPIHVEPNEENIRYLRTKRDHLGHLIEGG